MHDIVVIKNNSTGQEFEISPQQWNKARNAPEFRGVFSFVRRITEPPEVVALKARKAMRKGNS